MPKTIDNASTQTPNWETEQYSFHLTKFNKSPGKSLINIYFDEKGPQETFSPAENPEKTLPFKHGSDKMKSYILSGFSVPDENSNRFSKAFHESISSYLEKSKRKKLSDSEIKGEYIFKKFNKGIASIHYNQFLLLKSLNEIYHAYQCDLLTISSSKYSMAVSAKLANWFFDLSENDIGLSLAGLKFFITKYIEEDASKDVIESLLDPQMQSNRFLEILNLDFQKKLQEPISDKYRARNEWITLTSHLINNLLQSNLSISPYPLDSNKMQWFRIEHFLDLWFTQKKELYGAIQFKIYTDRGIPESIFAKSRNENPYLFPSKIYSSLDSEKFAGIQFADIFASLTGKLLSGLIQASKPRDNTSRQKVLIDESYYLLKEHQFESAQIINDFLFQKDSIYGFILDPSSGDEQILKTYLAEICSYTSFQAYQNVTPKEHASRHFRRYVENQLEMIDELDLSISNSIEIYGSFREAVDRNIVLPL